MLPKPRRLRHPDDFAAAIRLGVRAGRRTLVVHLVDGAVDVPAIAGFVVSKAVGNSVIRHSVVRRLRHLIAPLLGDLPAGARMVVRALPAASSSSTADLSADLTSALAGAKRKLESARPQKSGQRTRGQVVRSTR